MFKNGFSTGLYIFLVKSVPKTRNNHYFHIPSINSYFTHIYDTEYVTNDSIWSHYYVKKTTIITMVTQISRNYSNKIPLALYLIMQQIRKFPRINTGITLVYKESNSSMYPSQSISKLKYNDNDSLCVR